MRFRRSSVASSRRLEKSCRAFQSRTVSVVRRAACSWRAISGCELPDLEWSGGECLLLAKTVKRYLSQELPVSPEFLMGFHSIKKLLPDSCRCMEDGMLDDLVSTLGLPPRQLPDGYLAFVEKEVSRLFRKGWDASYETYCLTTSPPLSSCVESGRAEGGSLGVLNEGQAGFLDRVLHGRGQRLCPRYAGKLLVVQSAGKPRPLSKFPAEALYLRPLHKTIYGSLSKKKWLLRGPPTGTALDSVGFMEGGGRLVSGDYASATDNLPVEVMELALEVMLRNAAFVPSNVKELARRACRPILFSEKSSLEVTRGQMMGSYLSFPFLCLQNYLAFRWALSKAGVSRHVPVLINGDDILYQEPKPGFAETWFSTVSAVGLEVERTKTSVEDSFGSLNSTLLRWVDGSLVPVWTPRFGMLRPAEHPGMLGSNFLSFLRECPSDLRFLAGREWFRWHVGELRSSEVSLPSLGFRGLLAKRLGRLFKLPEGSVREFPPYFLQHGVVFDADFVQRVATSAVSSEERLMSSIEIAAGKWSHGWLPADRTSAAIRYCIARTAVKQSSITSYPWGSYPLYSSDEEFSFHLRNLPGACRLSRSARRGFLDPFPVPKETLLVSSIVDSLDAGFFGLLPPYEELPTPEWNFTFQYEVQENGLVLQEPRAPDYFRKDG